MKRRTVFGLMTAGALGLVAAGGAVAYGAHGGGRHAIMKRMVVAAIDDALDEAKVTPEQRAQINQIRDRAFQAVEQARAATRRTSRRASGSSRPTRSIPPRSTRSTGRPTRSGSGCGRRSIRPSWRSTAC